MAKLNWKVIHDCDEEDGTPTCWAAEINHQLHGNWCWITNKGSYFADRFSVKPRIQSLYLMRISRTVLQT